MLPARKPRRADDRERARARILAAASHLFCSRGIENVTFGDIARRARLSRPLVYFYFPDQRTLLLETVLAAQRRLRARFARASAGAPHGLAEAEALGRAYLAFHAEDPEAFFLCMAVGPGRARRGRHAALEQALAAQEQEVLGFVVNAIARGQRDGSIDPAAGPPLLVSLCLWSLSHGLAQFTSVQREALTQVHRVPTRTFLSAGIGLLIRALSPPRRRG